jgi:predicted transcriptional regulator
MTQWFQSRSDLGPLEMKLLRTLWQCGSATVREIVARGQVAGAYTTLMTTLDRLHKKGILDRAPEGRAFRYSPRQTEDEFRASIAATAIHQMLGASERAAAPLSYLVEAVTDYDRSLLDELERAIERKRAELGTRPKPAKDSPDTRSKKR